MRPDITCQTQDEEAFKIAQFQIDWERKKIICPMRKNGLPWLPGHGPHGKLFIQIHFRKQDCLECPSRAHCTRTKSAGRNVTLQPTKEQPLALQAIRERQKSKIFWDTYSIRSGIEGTIHPAVEKLGMRRRGYRRITKTKFQHLITAAAINIQRMLSWFAEVPRSVTYQSHFAALVTA